MPRREYRQHCALARALDVVGERWTLLLVRELLTGPMRYGELLANLAGMGTNLLAARLKELEGADVIERHKNGYRLTESGRELEPAVIALARFGASRLGSRRPDDVWRASWNVVALKYAFRPERAPKKSGVIEFRVDDTIVQASLAGGTIETALGTTWDTDATIATDGHTLLALGAGEVDLDDAERSGRVTVTGNRAFLLAALGAFAVA